MEGAIWGVIGTVAGVLISGILQRWNVSAAAKENLQLKRVELRGSLAKEVRMRLLEMEREEAAAAREAISRDVGALLTRVAELAGAKFRPLGAGEGKPASVGDQWGLHLPQWMRVELTEIRAKVGEHLKALAKEQVGPATVDQVDEATSELGGQVEELFTRWRKGLVEEEAELLAEIRDLEAK